MARRYEFYVREAKTISHLGGKIFQATPQNVTGSCYLLWARLKIFHEQPRPIHMGSPPPHPPPSAPGQKVLE